MEQALLIQVHLGAPRVERAKLGRVLNAAGIDAPFPPAPSAAEVIHDLVLSRAGLTHEFGWRWEPDPARWSLWLEHEGAEPMGYVLESGEGFQHLPIGLASAFDAAVKHRRIWASDVDIARVSSSLLFHKARGLTLERFLGLPGPVLVHPSMEDNWRLCRGIMRDTIPQVVPFLIVDRPVVSAHLMQAVSENLRTAFGLLAAEVDRAQQRLCDVARPPAPVVRYALLLGQVHAYAAVLETWAASVGAIGLPNDALESWEQSQSEILSSFQRLDRDLRVMIGCFAGGAP